MTKNIVWVAVCIMVAAVVSVGLVACGGKGSSEPAPSATTYSMSGTVTSSSIALQNATMTLSGAIAATSTTDASGNYTFTGLSNGNYTLTPSKTGYTFNPTNSTQTVNGANLTGVNFTASTPTVTANDYAGSWHGSGVSSSITGTNTFTSTLTLTSSLTGSYLNVFGIKTRHYNLTTPASISNGVISFNLPLAEENVSLATTDCNGWSVACTGTLSNDKTTLTNSCSGFFCGNGSASPGSFTDTLTK